MFSVDTKSRWILILEGIASASVQFLVLRQTVPFVGSSVLTASIIITIFLAALAFGYQYGGKVLINYKKQLTRNLYISTALLGIGISYPVVSFIFDTLNLLTSNISIINNPLVHLAIYSSIIMAPLIFFLAQTVPLMINNSHSERAAEAAGNTTALSTWGNVIGGLLSTLIFMYYLGIGWTIFINCLILGGCILYINYSDNGFPIKHAIQFTLLASLCFKLNVIYESHHFSTTTPYANYVITHNDSLKGKQLVINRSNASFIDDTNRSGWPYIEIIKSHLSNKKYANANILILGAGGFSLTADKKIIKNITYVDIDPNIKEIAETYFLDSNINGDFVAQDARAYLLKTDKKWDVIVVDVYSNLAVIPWHLTTTEFYQLLNSHLTYKGLAVLNVAANPYLEDDFSMNLDQTIRSVLQRCVTDITAYKDNKQSLVYLCHRKSGNMKSWVYRDDNTRATIDSYIASINTEELNHEKPSTKE